MSVIDTLAHWPPEMQPAQRTTARDFALVALMALLLVGGCGVVPADRVNTDCRWASDTSTSRDAAAAAARRQLRSDAILAEELAIRYADAHRGFRSGRYAGGAVYERSREQCLATLVAIVARDHGVTAQEVRGAMRERSVLVDLGAVFLPMALVFVFAGDVIARKVCRVFTPDQRTLRLLTIALAALPVTLLGSQLGSFWSFTFEEQIRLRTTHLSYRAFFVPWSRHAMALAAAGFVLCGIAALVRCHRTPSPASEPRDDAAALDLGLRE